MFGKKVLRPQCEAEIDIEHLPIASIEWKNGQTCLSMVKMRDDSTPDWDEEFFVTTPEEHKRFVERFRRKLGVDDTGWKAVKSETGKA